MSNVLFLYNGKETLIKCSPKDIIKDVCNSFAIIANIIIENVIFIYNGIELNCQLKIMEMKSIFIGKNIIIILVYDIDKYKYELNEININSNEIECSKCNEKLIINVKSFYISFKCKNCSNINNTLINQNEIECDICYTNNVINNEFYKCPTCNKNLCSLCKSSHEEKHFIVSYDKGYLIEYIKRLLINDIHSI